jgi:DNA-binding IscR family transcriptional regulator
MSYDILPSILGDTVPVKLVEFFLVNNEGMFQLTDIAKMIGISHSRVHDLIGNLVKYRIVFESRQGRNRLFELNKNNPVVKQLQELYRVTRAYKIASEY